MSKILTPDKLKSIREDLNTLDEHPAVIYCDDLLDDRAALIDLLKRCEVELARWGDSGANLDDFELLSDLRDVTEGEGNG